MNPEQLVAASVALGLLLGGFFGYWLAHLEQVHEALISYVDLHRHVHDRLGLKPPRGQT